MVNEFVLLGKVIRAGIFTSAARGAYFVSVGKRLKAQPSKNDSEMIQMTHANPPRAKARRGQAEYFACPVELLS